MARGKGVILLTGHFTTLELGARFITLLQPFPHAMYRPHKNPLYEAIQRRQREARSRMPPLPHEDLRGLLRAFRRGNAVWYAPDQNHGLRNSVFVPFFGVPACTLTATPAGDPEWRGGGTLSCAACRMQPVMNWSLPALEQFPSDDPVADATRINALLEQHIRQAPEQYLWVHRRFKTRPPDQISPYAP